MSDASGPRVPDPDGTDPQVDGSDEAGPGGAGRPVDAVPAAKSAVLEASASDTPGADLPGTDLPGTDLPGTDLPESDIPVSELSASDSQGSGSPGPGVLLRDSSSPESRAREEAELRLAEALVFGSAGPVTARALSQILPDSADVDAVIAALRERYAGRGVELAEVGGGVMFRTAEDLAPLLRKVVHVPRRLPRVAMETLAIIAYHQPVTRAEIEEIRGTSLAQQTLEALMEAGLIMLKGRRETPGRPAIWGTTPQFLAQFGLNDLRDLPRREDLLLELPIPTAAAAGSGPAEGMVAETEEEKAVAGASGETAGDAIEAAPEDAVGPPDRSSGNHP